LILKCLTNWKIAFSFWIVFVDFRYEIRCFIQFSMMQVFIIIFWILLELDIMFLR
jgi:hypothetical protein